MRQAIVLLCQVTLADVRKAAANLDVPTLIRQTAALVPYVPDVPDDEDARLVRALLEVPFGKGSTPAERLAPYIQAGVAGDWLTIILSLRVRGDSALAHPEAVSGAYVFDDKNLVPAPRLLGSRDRLLRSRARTLGVVLERKPGGPDLARVPPVLERTEDVLFDTLVAELDERVRPTVGGDAFLAPDPAGRALSVLAATVAAMLGDSACRRLSWADAALRGEQLSRLWCSLWGWGGIAPTATSVS